MNDTIIPSSTVRQGRILQLLSDSEGASSSDIHQKLEGTASLVTIKRDLDALTESGYCLREGRGPATVYRKTVRGLLYTPFVLSDYIKRPVDNRAARIHFNDRLFHHFPAALFSTEIIQTLETQTKQYKERQSAASPVIRQKELERFVIELAWKSSAIEGNTYTLLDTERLIKEGVASPHYSPDETQMILNHKIALHFVIDTIAQQKAFTVSQRFIEQVHTLLVKDLGVASGLRKILVGITGTAYRPLDNQYHINEALAALYTAIEQLQHPVEKALVALAGLSYIQPFEDGNKRTARLVSNAILLAEQHAPLSYRSTDIDEYRNAMVLFYEQNSIIAIQNIFLEQYKFSTENYLVS